MKTKITSLKEHHLQALAKLGNNEKVAKNLMDRFPHPYLLKDAYEFWELTKKENPTVTFAIEFRKEFAGIISVIPQSDIYRSNGELGYWVGEPYWGQGIASAAVGLITSYAFKSLGLHRVYAQVFDHNTTSMKVLANNGFKKEAILEKAAIKNEQLTDIHILSKLKA